MTWSKPWIIGWVLILLGLAFYEFWSGFGTGKSTPMLTQVTVRYCPWWVTMPFLTWLFIHFAIRYANPAYIAKLKGGS
jgi:hypothetical protein